MPIDSRGWCDSFWQDKNDKRKNFRFGCFFNLKKLKIHLNEQKKMFDFSFKFKKELIKTNV